MTGTKEPTYRGLPRIEANLFVGKPLGDYPEVWHKLADRLIADGWYFNTEVGEWVHGRAHPITGAELGWEFSERGRIAYLPDGSRAWLRHPGPENLSDRDMPTLPPDTHHTDLSDEPDMPLWSVELVLEASDLEHAGLVGDDAVDFLQAAQPDGWVCRVESVHTYEPGEH